MLYVIAPIVKPRVLLSLLLGKILHKSKRASYSAGGLGQTSSCENDQDTVQ